MSTILDKIHAQKILEVRDRKEQLPLAALERRPHFKRSSLSLKTVLQRNDQLGIIAEIKRKSPSKGVINPTVSIEDISTGYVKAGVSALSILTDLQFFGGSTEDLAVAREHNNCPILRKDFMVDEYQVLEAKSIGADVILLIAAMLNVKTAKGLCDMAHSLGLEVLLEIHNEQELESHGSMGADLMGINNRDLKTFEVNIDVSRRLSALIPKSMVKVSESGIDSPEAIMALKGLGFQGFLIGQAFMEKPVPGEAARIFMNRLKELESQHIGG